MTKGSLFSIARSHLDNHPHVPFSGTAIYVYFILDNAESDGVTTRTAMNISLDDQPVGEFIHEINDTDTFQYNGLVYSQTNLTSETHTVFLSADGVYPGSLLLFDYAVYTYVTGSNSLRRHHSLLRRSVSTLR